MFSECNGIQRRSWQGLGPAGLDGCSSAVDTQVHYGATRGPTVRDDRRSEAELVVVERTGAVLITPHLRIIWTFEASLLCLCSHGRC